MNHTHHKSKVTPEQRATIVQRVEQGEYASAVAKEFGLSRERVRQYVDEDSSMSAEEIRASRSIRRFNANTNAVKHYAGEHPEAPVREIAATLHLSQEFVRFTIGNEETQRRRFVNRRVMDWNTSKFSDDDILADIRRVAAFAGEPLAYQKFDEYNKTVSGVRVLQRFGTWRTAAAKAGVEAFQPIRTYTRQFSQQDCLDAVMNFIQHNPYGTYAAFDKFQQSQPGPGAQTIRNLSGMKWSELQAHARHELGMDE